MIIPSELSGKVYKTRFSGLSSNFKKMDNIRLEWPNSEIDVIYETLNQTLVSRVVIIFETQEDCLAFTIKYGKEYA